MKWIDPRSPLVEASFRPLGPIGSGEEGTGGKQRTDIVWEAGGGQAEKDEDADHPEACKPIQFMTGSCRSLCSWRAIPSCSTARGFSPALIGSIERGG